jgi:heme a synthase
MEHSRFNKFAWFFVGYLVVVILFGAWVRIAGAGAGCGNHWPTCHGEVIPTAPETATIIEFTHRVTSGLCGIFAIVLVGWARKVNRRVFWAAVATLFFVLVEGFIGAVLVKKELVAGDASLSRAVVISLHLVNTMLLMAAAASTAWWSRPSPPGTPHAASDGQPVTAPRLEVAKGVLLAIIVALLLTNATGAVTALGDTLFPKQPALDGGLWAQVRDDLSVGQHFLVRLRILHPIVAVFSAMLLLGVTLGLQRRKDARDTPAYGILKGLQHTVLLQLFLGVVNVLLAAPGWMQIIHLLVAQGLWVMVWLLALETWPGNEQTAQEPALGRQLTSET